MSLNNTLQESEEDQPGGRLLRMAKGMLVGLTVFFFIASLAQLIYLHKRITGTPKIKVLELASKRISSASSDQELLPLIELESRVALEVLALKRRYHQANVLLMSRIWVSYLSFVTGMILCLVGGSFILGRIRESATKLEADSTVAKFSIASSSPGIILATLGTLLIMTSILTNHRIAVEDKSVYLQTYGFTPNFLRSIPGPHVEPADPNNEALKNLDRLLNCKR